MSRNSNVELNVLENKIINIFSDFSMIMENFNSMLKNEKREFLNENDSCFKILSNLMEVRDELHLCIDEIYKENNNKVLLNKIFECEEMMYEIDILKKKYNELKGIALSK
jgi:hypothetical protein